MKKFLLALAFGAGLLANEMQAQKFAYVDSKYILEHVQEYADAQVELNKLSSDWQVEIEDKYAAIQRLKDSYYAEKSLLTEDMKTRRLEEIRAKEDEALALQVEKFGVEGELFERREALIKPIQDQMYTALQEVAGDRGYMVIFDKTSQSNMLYTNPKFDVTDKIIKAMGYKPGETIEQPGKEEGKEGGKDAGGGAKSGGAKDGMNSGNTKGQSGGGATAPRPKGGR